MFIFLLQPPPSKDMAPAAQLPLDLSMSNTGSQSGQPSTSATTQVCGVKLKSFTKIYSQSEIKVVCESMQIMQINANQC